LFYNVSLNKKTLIDSVIFIPKRFPKNLYKKTRKILQSNKSDKLQQITAFLNNQTDFKLKNSPKIVFNNNKSVYLIELTNDKKNSFNAFAGFGYDETEKKLKLYGEIDTELFNIFNTGEKISFKWQKNNKIQDLAIHSFFPYILGSNFNLSGNILSSRKDTINAYFQSASKLGWQINNHQINISYVTNQKTENATKTNNSFIGSGYYFEKPSYYQGLFNKNFSANLYFKSKKFNNLVFFGEFNYFFEINAKFLTHHNLGYLHNGNSGFIIFNISKNVFRIKNDLQPMFSELFGLKNEFIFHSKQHFFYIIGDFFYQKNFENIYSSYVNSGIGIKIINKNQILTLEIIKPVNLTLTANNQQITIIINHIIRF
jgi:hypothetical protein